MNAEPDKEWLIISSPITCPECGETEFLRSETQREDIEEVMCINCGLVWHEHVQEWDEDDHD